MLICGSNVIQWLSNDGSGISVEYVGEFVVRGCLEVLFHIPMWRRHFVNVVIRLVYVELCLD